MWRIGLFGGAPDSVRWPGWPGGEVAALGNLRDDVAINHRTVRWCTRLSGEPTALVANGRLRDQRAIVSGVPTDPKIQRLASLEKERDRAPDCPVHHSTESENCLPS
jgi:hypothetical protein